MEMQIASSYTEINELLVFMSVSLFRVQLTAET